MFDETAAQKNSIIKRQTQFPSTPEELILSGPHFFIGNPFYQIPQHVVVHHLQVILAIK